MNETIEITEGDYENLVFNIGERISGVWTSMDLTGCTAAFTVKNEFGTETDDTNALFKVSISGLTSSGQIIFPLTSIQTRLVTTPKVCDIEVKDATAKPTTFWISKIIARKDVTRG
jgi:hypothetical protein